MNRMTVLLVDDDKTILDALRTQILQMFADLACECAESVPEAWEVLEELCDAGEGIAVVVSDWLMPDVRGDDFLAAMKERYPATRRVMLTGQADRAALDRVAAEGLAFLVIHKPWSPDDLRRALQ